MCTSRLTEKNKHARRVRCAEPTQDTGGSASRNPPYVYCESIQWRVRSAEPAPRTLRVLTRARPVRGTRPTLRVQITTGPVRGTSPTYTASTSNGGSASRNPPSTASSYNGGSASRNPPYVRPAVGRVPRSGPGTRLRGFLVHCRGGLGFALLRHGLLDRQRVPAEAPDLHEVHHRIARGRGK